MEEEKEFTVKDKRRFTEGAEGANSSQKEAPAEAQREAPTGQKGTRAHDQAETQAHPAEINFASFIFSLGRSAFIHLGEEADPMTGQKQVSLPLAKETIDIISLLEEKTKGNLTTEEAQLLKNILYALRMRFVELASKGP